MSEEIDIKGIDKAELTAALYNGSKPQGLGFLHASPNEMTAETARSIIEQKKGDVSFEYLQGRVMKVDLNGDAFSPYLFDRDNGQGAARSVVEAIKARVQPRQDKQKDIGSHVKGTGLKELGQKGLDQGPKQGPRKGHRP